MRAALALALVVAVAQPAAGSERIPDVEWVSREELLSAMEEETGYDPTATTNVARFQACVFLRLVRRARERRPEGPPLFIHHEEWYRAFLESQGLGEDEAPIAERLAHEHQQSTWLDDRPGRVVEEVIEGPAPRLAVNVVSGPPPDAELPEDYSYEDTLSRPRLEVTVKRTVRYRLLELEDQVVFDEIEGVYGRPTTGLLAVLFEIIGKARAVWTRMAFGPDGWQVNVSKGSKGFISKTATITVAPDGTAERGVPDDRPDLAELAAPLRESLEIEYVPWTETGL